VEVFDSKGAVISGTSLSLNYFVASFVLTALAGFWQYGILQWDEFYRYLISFVVTTTSWSNFPYDSTTLQHGAPCESGVQIVQPGHYTLLSSSE
jgi:hypothetical protein